MPAMTGVVVDGNDSLFITTNHWVESIVPPRDAYGSIVLVQSISSLVAEIEGLTTVLERTTPTVQVDLHDSKGIRAVVMIGLRLLGIREVVQQNGLHLPAPLMERAEYELSILFAAMHILRARWKWNNPEKPLSYFYAEFFAAMERAEVGSPCTMVAT